MVIFEVVVNKTGDLAMKKIMSIAVVALLMAGSAAFACDSCGCAAKKAEKKAECTSCPSEKKCAEGCAKECCAKKEAKKCAEGCAKKCCAKEDAKAE
jgi:hypothetical protein